MPSFDQPKRTGSDDHLQQWLLAGEETSGHTTPGPYHDEPEAMTGVSATTSGSNTPALTPSTTTMGQGSRPDDIASRAPGTIPDILMGGDETPMSRASPRDPGPPSYASLAGKLAALNTGSDVCSFPSRSKECFEMLDPIAKEIELAGLKVSLRNPAPFKYTTHSGGLLKTKVNGGLTQTKNAIIPLVKSSMDDLAWALKGFYNLKVKNHTAEALTTASTKSFDSSATSSTARSVASSIASGAERCDFCETREKGLPYSADSFSLPAPIKDHIAKGLYRKAFAGGDWKEDGETAVMFVSDAISLHIPNPCRSQQARLSVNFWNQCRDINRTFAEAEATRYHSTKVPYRSDFDIRPEIDQELEQFRRVANEAEGVICGRPPTTS